MQSAAGGAGTYASLRPKMGRKKKAVAAAPGEQIQDMAASVTTETPAKESTPNKKSRTNRRAPKGLVEATAEAMNGAGTSMPEVGEPLPPEIAPEQPVATQANDERARRRAERAEKRKALLGNR
jgi:hypothetical protein